MTIRKYTEGMELKPGMYVNCEGPIRHTFAGKARRIVSVTPKAMQTVVCGREDYGQEQKLKRLVLWVCDTEEEAKAMEDASCEMMKRAFVMEQELTSQIAKMKNDEARKIISKLNGEAA